jgi:two-component system response regulator RegX3
VPAALPDAPPPRPVDTSGRGLEGVRVLVVDDEDPVRVPIARYLARRGAEVREARDGREALEELEHFAADVVLADLRMPRMSGAELYAHLVERRPALAERVVILSGDISQLDSRDALPVPAERVLAKPAELKEIEAKVRAVAGYAGAATVSRPTNAV